MARTHVPRPTRRGLLGAGVGLGALAGLAGCGATGSSGTSPGASSAGAASGGADPEVDRVFYGSDRDHQFVDVRRPTGRTLGTVALIHGGYWQAGYGLDLMNALATRFTELGHVTWNVEYRSVGAGGGWPTTFTDVAAALDRIPRESGVPREVVLLGHSAGGHLAGWAASRSARTPGGAPTLTPRSAISLSGLLDLSAAATAPESAGPTRALMGGTPAQQPERYALGDPALLVPAACPVVAVQATQETVIPTDQSASYAAKARAAGGRVTEVALEGDHFTLIDPTHPSFARLQRLVTRALA